MLIIDIVQVKSGFHVERNGAYWVHRSDF